MLTFTLFCSWHLTTVRSQSSLHWYRIVREISHRTIIMKIKTNYSFEISLDKTTFLFILTQVRDAYFYGSVVISIKILRLAKKKFSCILRKNATFVSIFNYRKIYQYYLIKTPLNFISPRRFYFSPSIFWYTLYNECILLIYRIYI